VQLSIKGFAMASGLLWGGGVLFVGLLNLVVASYGTTFLQVMSSVYPGFHFARTFGDVLIGGAYGLVDGAIAGFLFGWLYNIFASSRDKA
jgi:hypothetical protein